MSQAAVESDLAGLRKSMNAREEEATVAQSRADSLARQLETSAATQRRLQV
jgi:hypothetical protein